jgi:hypothetical protein
MINLVNQSTGSDQAHDTDARELCQPSECAATDLRFARVGGHSPMSFFRNFSASSPTGYRNKRGANGTIAAKRHHGEQAWAGGDPPHLLHPLKALLRSACECSPIVRAHFDRLRQ